MLDMRHSNPLEEAIDTLGAVLSDRGLHYELVVVGGGSLMLLGLLDRPTKDIDIVALVREGKYQSAEPLPKPLEEAVKDVASTRLHVAGRLDQIHLKLYASIDQGPQSKHFADLRRLEPTPEELLLSARWARTHDPSPAFKNELEAALQELGVQNAKL
jgi:hypothetical protein